MSAPVNPAIRLLSPEKRRIYPNARTGAYLPRQRMEATEPHPTLRQRDGLKPGQPDDMTWDALVRVGWTAYEGPAQTDENGYIIVGLDGLALHDPLIRPNVWTGKHRGQARYE